MVAETGLDDLVLAMVLAVGMVAKAVMVDLMFAIGIMVGKVVMVDVMLAIGGNR